MNDPWFWGADYNDNRAHGHIPMPVVLLAARFSSTLMLALSVALVFRIGWLLRGRSAAWIGALMVTTLPAVLLNVRRAMFEGATLLVIALVIYLGLLVARRLHTIIDRRKWWRSWLALGLGCGFAIASKHSLLIVVVPVLGQLLILGRQMLGWAVRGVLMAGLVSVAVFLVLNPAWWSAPFTVPGEVLRLREGILKAQVDIFGGYQNVQDRVSALARYPLGTAQYYEDKQNWMAWIGDQVRAYEASGLNGFDWMRLGILVYLVAALGLVSL